MKQSHMKEIKLSISDKALVTLKDLVFGSMLGDNYGGCQQAWKKIIDAINNDEDTVEVITKEEKDERTKKSEELMKRSNEYWKQRNDELKFVEGWDEERKAELAQAEALAESRDAEREAERDSEFGPEKDLVLEGISQLNKLANFKPGQQ